MLLLKKITSLPDNLKYKAIELAVFNFVNDSHTLESKADPKGLYNQTIESISAATTFGTAEARQFWIAEEDGEVMSYVLANVSKDVDNSLCYWINQAYVHKKYRGTKMTKVWHMQLVNEAKRLMCKHIIMPSSRNPEAYKRFLGMGIHTYVTLLKQDL